MRFVAVVGSATCDDETASRAERVGRLLAEAGFGVVCGGCGGVMEAACRGAASAGALTVGILPGTDRSQANPFVAVALPTGLGEARNQLVVLAAEGLVAVGGEWGTLSEIALARKAGKPVVSLGSWSVHPDILPARSPEEALAVLLSRLGG